MNNKKLVLLFLSFALLFLSACKQHKEIQRIKADEKRIVIPASFSLADSIQSHSYKYHTLSAKIKTEFISTDGSELSLMVTMRAVSDSAIWMSASPALGIEAARILFTRDSIKIMDKIHGEYASEPYSFLKKFTQADLTFEMLQNILTGNVAFMSKDFHTDSITRYYSAHCSQADMLQELIITKVFRIFANIITDKTTHDEINVYYGDFQFVENEYLPFGIKIEANSKGKTATIVMNYSSVSVNLPVEIKFNIPASYTQMKY